MKAYRVDFTYSSKEQASMHVVAETPEIAGKGALQILQETDDIYSTAEVVAVEEVKKQETPTIN